MLFEIVMGSQYGKYHFRERLNFELRESVAN
jgi:hypothetical protein